MTANDTQNTRPDDHAAALPADLAEALERAASAERLLVVSDFDGTLAPFTEDPTATIPQPGSTEALSALAALPDTAAALVSGRALEVLREVSTSPTGVELVGSHGAESSGGMPPLTADEQDLLARITDASREIVADTPGARVETKPTAAVVHVRAVSDTARGDELLAATLSGPAALPGVHVTEGKAVVEMSVRPASKGRAIATLTERLDADVALLVGDDVTDEAGFAAMRDGDVTVKVGAGETAARYRVADIPAVVTLLETLHAARSARI